jgi:hypothetical protein
MRALLLAALPLALAATASAQPTLIAQPDLRHPLTLSVDVEPQWQRDRSYDHFKHDDPDRGVSALLEVARLARGTLSLGAGLHGNDLANGGPAAPDIGFLVPSVSALLRWSPHRWIEPHVRLSADLTHAHLTLDLRDGNIYEDSRWSAGGSAGAGLRLRTGTLATALNGGRLGLTGALIVEGGVHLGQPLSFEVTRRTPADARIAADRLPASSTRIGDLGRSHAYLRISFALLL